MAINLLVEKIKETQAPVVVGLDPQFEIIPKHINQYSRNIEDYRYDIINFNKEIIDNIYDLVPAVKLQIGFYEMYGFQGIDAYIETIKYAKSKGLIVIGDIKRGDIASTARAYSHGHLGRIHEPTFPNERIVYNQDFITVNPYMGFDSIEPFLADCEEYNRSLFVLLKTSNPSSSDIQDLVLENGKPLYTHVAELIKKWGEPSLHKDKASGFSKVGAVVGATHPAVAKELRAMLPNAMFLVPGYGAQGATGKDLSAFFTKDISGALINSSRGIISAYKNNKKYKEEEFGLAAREATQIMIKDIVENI